MTTEHRRPWWQLTRTSGVGFAMGAMWAVFALLMWSVLSDGSTRDVLVSVLWTLLAAVFLTGAVLLRRRERAALSSTR